MFRSARFIPVSSIRTLFFVFLFVLTLLPCAYSQDDGENAGPELKLASGSPTPFTVSAGGRLQLGFIHPGNRFTGLRVSIAASAVLSFEGTCAGSAGEYSIDLRQKCEIEGTAGPSTLVDVLPQFCGRQSVVLTNEARAPVQGTVEAVDMGALPSVSISDKPGTLIVRKGAKSKLQILPDMPDDSGSSVSFENFNPSDPILDVTPDGDAAYTVPPGLWKVKGIGDGSEVPIETHFVPVMSGKTTVIENWPIIDPGDATETAGVSGLKLRSVATEGSDIRIRFSTPDWKGTISTADLSVQEGGMPGEVTDVRPLASPLRLVLLLDSSGSMKSDMKNVLSAAEAFLKGLPKGTIVDLIDFDTKPKPLATAAPAALFKALKGIKADGATALNDTVIQGLKRTAGHDRPAVVLLTDGFDANHNDTGPG
ncbi:MAG TPA: vWA domain-containing protein, partial [Candidatus Ozemobacteraceae bacterium]|nr:vWA domain-containing protein [Candidatus Ozemobacteraceae bacterium]